jgi:glycosidase
MVQPEPAEPPAHPDAAVHPEELRRDEFFRRRGTRFASPSELTVLDGDFFHLRQLATNYREDGSFPVRELLIRIYQYLIAKFDVDGYRIDTLGYLDPAFARAFGRAMREFAQSIGKLNFFTFGEVVRNEEEIARFVGRPAAYDAEPMGVDSALDFPVFGKLPGVVKGFDPPADLVDVFEQRRRVHRGVLGSHGEPGSFFVTFLDNHDQHRRFGFVEPPDRGRFDDQLTLALGCLFCLQGIPCVYYGTEQGLCGDGQRFEAVREALWGKADAFDLSHPFAQACSALSNVRAAQPALRYGRQYFRPLSGNGTDFGISRYPGGVLAFSRLLSDLEVVVVANTNTSSPWSGDVILERLLNPVGAPYSVVFSNLPGPAPTPGPVAERAGGRVLVHEVDGAINPGPVRVLPVTVRPMEIQVLLRS